MQESKLNPVQRAARAMYRTRRRLATVFAVILALVFAYHAVFGHNGITAYAQKRSEDQALSEEIQKLQSENARLQTHVDHLRNDPDAIEHEARERLHYARPGEVIYTLNDPIQTGHPAGH
jgi:cell division protein FtsB